MIKVCHIAEPTTGGVFTHLKQLAGMSKGEIHQTFIMSSVENPDLATADHFCGHRLYVIDMAKNIRIRDDFRSLQRLIAHLRHNKYDIVHCHSSKAGALGRIAAFVTGHRNVVYTPHSFAFLSKVSMVNKLFYLLVEWLLSFISTRIVCVSEGEREKAKPFIKQSKMTVVNNGIRVNERKPRVGSTEEKITIGFVGRLTKQKNPIVLIETALLLDKEKFQFVVMGDGEFMVQLKRKIEEYNLQAMFDLRGTVHNVYDELVKCNLYISTSLWESTPYSILEAMSVGVPVIATDIPGVNNIVKHRVNGFLVPPNDPVALVETIVGITNQGARSQLVEVTEQAYETIQDRYSEDHMFRSYIRLYQELGGYKE